MVRTIAEDFQVTQLGRAIRSAVLISFVLSVCLSGGAMHAAVAGSNSNSRLKIELHKGQGQTPGFLLMSKDIYSAIHQALVALEERNISASELDTITVMPGANSILVTVFARNQLQVGGGYEVVISTSDFKVLSVRPAI